ncbi:hypothetical protein DCO48_08510 [Pseudomonas sp. SDI]|uniref:hypothetical protein n=1 Tax=Pseudomonas sp. SDI TaxID=2170734 RepID=UPI000DE626FD|nr:hypothetical protein [Pseudomonas sp. SDI]PWB33690.1 hypothetical protein DCO48_08510 [Pseudomonas sp. SDI]
MLTFDSSRVSKALNSASTTQTKQPSSSPVEDKPTTPAVTFPDTRESVSSLAQQLSNAAARAEVENAGLDFAELAEKATRIVDQLFNRSDEVLRDAEVPNSDDSQRLDQARKASNFSNGIGRNPFKGMPRDQLALIAYDESGDFTINERRAAWEEAFHQESAWRQQVIKNSQEEYHNTGKITEFCTALLKHYNELPTIEQARYPVSYPAELQHDIDTGFNYKTGQKEAELPDLFSMLERYFDKGSLESKTPPNEAESTEDAISIKEGLHKTS